MRLIVVEPHPDDAFLSVGWHIESIWPGEGYQVTIVTVYHDNRRGKEAENYARAVGAGYLGLGLTQSKMLGPRGSLRQQGLDAKLRGLKGDVLILPLGLQHPDHLRVSRVMSKKEKWYYVDTPYQLKLKNQYELQRRLEGRQIVSCVYPPARKFKHADLFKSQSKFFHFNPTEKIRTHELLVL